MQEKNNFQKIGFGAGCFWGIQSVFDQIEGVLSSKVGYQGGNSQNPSYQQVCSGTTNHIETLHLDYDLDKVDTEKLLLIFFKNHNPTTKNQQGPDIGTQYRSAIFYYTDLQLQKANKAIEELQLGMDGGEGQSEFTKIGQTYRGKKVVTEILNGNLYPYYNAEEYHQKYFAKKGIVRSCYI